MEDMEEKLKKRVKKGLRKGFIKEKSTVILLSGWIQGPEHLDTIRITTVCNINTVHV